MLVGSFLKDINKKINFDLSNLVQWLLVNKIGINVNKTDIVIFCLQENKSLKNELPFEWSEN